MQRSRTIPVTLSMYRDRQTETSPNTDPLWANPACNSTSRCQLQPHCGCTLRLHVASCDAPSQPREAGAGTHTHASQEQAHTAAAAGHAPNYSHVRLAWSQPRTQAPGIPAPARGQTVGWPCGCRACKRHIMRPCDSNNSPHHHPKTTHQQPVTPPAAGARCACSGRTTTRARQHTPQQLQHTPPRRTAAALSLSHTQSRCI